MTDVDENQLIDEKAAAKMLACSTRQLRRLWQSGSFPMPIRFGNAEPKYQRKRWLRSEVADWIQRHAAARRPA